MLSPPIANFVRDAGSDSIEKLEQWLMQPPEGKTPMKADQMVIIVAGGSNNNYYSIGGLRYMQSVQIDKCR